MATPTTEEANRVGAIVAAYLAARDRGAAPSLEELLARNADVAARLQELLRLERDVSSLAGRLRPRAAEQPLPARIGDYEILREIARGGMGVVYEARHRRLDRVVALKMVQHERLASADDLERFRREMRAVASIDHPGIVPIYEVGEHAGVPYFAMRYVPGGTLAEHVEDLGDDPRRAADVVRKLALAVQAAHERGILHRDLKPGNVLIDRGGEPRITDFGLAKRLDTEASLTRTQATVGTPSYMAPEQVSRTRGEIGVPADVYGLGAILYQLLTRRPPFDAESSYEILRRVVEEEPPAPRTISPSIPRDLETITLRCLEKQPDRRYASAGALARDLERYLEGLPVQARPITGLERTWRWSKRNPLAVAVGALLLVVAVGSWVGTALVSLQRNRAVKNLGRAEDAEADAQEKLRASLLAQARALRLSGRAGRRGESLAALREAARIRPGLDVRDEVIASLGLFDLVEERSWVGQPAENSRSFAMTPDFAIYARGDENGSVSVRSVADDRELARLSGPPNTRELRFGPEGRYLAATFARSAADADLVVWDWRAGEQRFRMPASITTPFAFGAAPATFAAGTSDGAVRIEDLDAGATVARLPVGSAPEALALHPRGAAVAVAAGKLVVVVDAVSGRVARTFGLPAAVRCLGWSPDGEELAAGGDDRTIHRWNPETGAELPPCVGHERTVTLLAYATGGRTIASLSFDGTLRVWDRRTGAQILIEDLLGRQDPAWSFDARGERLGILRDELVVLMRLESPEFPSSLPRAGDTRLSAVAFVPESSLVVASGDDGIRIWDTAREELPAYVPATRMQAVLGLDDPPSVVTSGWTGLLRWPVRRMPRREGVYTKDAGRLVLGPPERVVEPPAGRRFGRASARADGGEFLVQNGSGGWGEAALVVDPGAGRARTALHHPGVVSVALDPGGRWAVTASWNGYDVLVWDLGQDPPTSRVLIPGRTNGMVRFSPRGTWLLSSTTSRGFQVWRTDTWELVHQDPGLPFEEAMAVRADESLAAVFGHGVIHLIDPHTWEDVARLEVPESVLSGLAFRTDGRWLAAAGSTVHLWDLSLLRGELAALGLDWDAPPSTSPQDEEPAEERELVVELGELADPVRWPERVPARFLAAEGERLDARLASDPADVETLLCRAVVNERMGRHREAALDLDRVGALRGEDAALRLRRADDLEEARLWTRAIADYDRVLAENADDLHARSRRASALVQMGRFGEAIDDLEHVLGQRPDDAWAANLLAWVLVIAPPELRDAARADALSLQALAAHPADAGVLNTRGAVLVRLARFDEALEVLENAHARRTRASMEDELFLALAHLGLGQRVEAEACYERAMAIPEGVTVEDALGVEVVVAELRALLAEPEPAGGAPGGR